MRKRSRLIAGGVALSLGSFFYIYSSATQVYKPLSSTVKEVAGVQTSLEAISGVKFASKLSSTYKLKRSNDAVEQSYNQYVFANIGREFGDQISITTGPTVFGQNVFDIPFVKSRTLYPNKYKQIFPVWLPSGAVAFENIESIEVGVFWQTTDTFASVVVSGTADRSSQLQTSLQSVIEHWEWQ